MPFVLMAALLLVARDFLARLGLRHPTVAEILQSTGAGRTRAYELRGRLLQRLPGLLRPVGRPPRERSAAEPDPTAALSREIATFLMDHPGAVSGGRRRRRYAESFRRRVVELREQHPELDLDTFARAVVVPAGTVEDWLRSGPLAEPGGEPEPNGGEPRDPDPRIQTVLAQWRDWWGDFTSFCRHLREHFRIGFGDTLLGRILFEHGERTPRRRAGRSPDELALRGAFVTFFPGAQWVGDGTEVAVEIAGQRFVFNLELDVDADSAAVVGAAITDTEDSQAVVDAFTDGVATTGAPPLALLLDNKPSNHTPEVDAALGETLRIRSTPGRAQTKAPVEGAFGLFSQKAPPLVFHSTEPRKLAREILALQVATWARTLNRRPRKDRGGKSRVDLYREHAPTKDEIEAAREALRERLRRQERARITREARADPQVRDTLDRAFERLELLDPDGHIRSAIARYSLDDVVDAIAVFEGKRNDGTLPEGADARYLLGIVQNIFHVHQADKITEALLRERLDARDRLLAVLERDKLELLRTATDPDTLLRSFVDRALDSRRVIDQRYWLLAAGDLVAAQPADRQPELLRSAARRIHSAFRLPRRERQAIERRLFRCVWPLH